jgi:hypothetical protein
MRTPRAESIITSAQYESMYVPFHGLTVVARVLPDFEIAGAKG